MPGRFGAVTRRLENHVPTGAHLFVDPEQLSAELEGVLEIVTHPEFRHLQVWAKHLREHLAPGVSSWRGQVIVHTLLFAHPLDKELIVDLLEPLDFLVGGDAFNAQKPVVAVGGNLFVCKVNLKGCCWSHLISSAAKKSAPF